VPKLTLHILSFEVVLSSVAGTGTASVRFHVHRGCDLT